MNFIELFIMKVHVAGNINLVTNTGTGDAKIPAVKLEGQLKSEDILWRSACNSCLFNIFQPACNCFGNGGTKVSLPGQVQGNYIVRA